MRAAYILDAVRTPIGKYGGGLAAVRPDDLLAQVLRSLSERNPSFDSHRIEDVIAGDANQAGEDTRNVARMAALLAGFPVTVAGNTVNRLCASGMQAVMDAARAIRCGEGREFIAAGVESMTRAPYVLLKSEGAFDRNARLTDTTIGWRFPNPRLTAIYPPYSMGETAEMLAAEWKIGREEQDAFALNSHEKYFRAEAAGLFREERVSVPVRGGLFERDEQPRRSSPELLRALKPLFREGGSVTAGNSSPINDGAAALWLADEQTVHDRGLRPLARIAGMAVAGVHPSQMGTGPIPAARKALERSGLQMKDIGLVEINEAFAVQVLVCMRELGIDPEILNVNGGAIALGNPLGCSGARIALTLAFEMRRRKVRYGLACMCAGMGQGAAIVLEAT